MIIQFLIEIIAFLKQIERHRIFNCCKIVKSPLILFAGGSVLATGPATIDHRGIPTRDSGVTFSFQRSVETHTDV